MPRFGRTSRRRLKTCHKDLQKVFNEVIKFYDCSILCGNRDKETQNKAYHDGRSTLVFPYSKHNSYPSLAVDVVPWFSNKPHIRWDDRFKFYQFYGYVMATADQLGVKLKCGANWDMDDELHDQSFIDMPHFELVAVEYV